MGFKDKQECTESLINTAKTIFYAHIIMSLLGMIGVRLMYRTNNNNPDKVFTQIWYGSYISILLGILNFSYSFIVIE